MRTEGIPFSTIKGLTHLILIVMASLGPCMAIAQSSRSPFEGKSDTRVRLWDDGKQKIRTRKTPVYVGAGVSLSYTQSTLESRIDRLNKLPLNFLGTNVEGMLGTPIGKVKANAGIFYSGASVPYTIDMYQGGLSGSIYLLRLTKLTYHTFEPYFTAGANYQGAHVYGNNLIDSDKPSNYSTTDPPLAGKVFNTQLNLGGGIEYQLENADNKFIHLFAEMTFGIPVHSSVSNHAFDGTMMLRPINISLGVQVGVFN